VVEGDGKLVGIITNRDMRFVSPFEKSTTLVRDVMTKAPLITAPVPTVQFSKIPALNSQWVQSPFLGASIFEHAPPAFA